MSVFKLVQNEVKHVFMDKYDKIVMTLEISPQNFTFGGLYSF